MCELTTSQKHIITELNNSRGEYKPAFMQIRIHDSYDVCGYYWLSVICS